MGELIVLAERLADRSRPGRGGSRPAFFYDLACPFSYLAAERVERLLGDVEWIPAGGLGPGAEGLEPWVAERAEQRAAELRLPLVWPDRFPSDAPGARRIAARAAEIGSDSRFALAALRLAFCGGFDLDDPEVLAEAAAAAGLTLEECLAAAGDPALDEVLNATTRGLIAQGVRQLPAVRVGHRFFDGERRLPEVSALLHAPVITGDAPVAQQCEAISRATGHWGRPMAPAG